MLVPGAHTEREGTGWRSWEKDGWLKARHPFGLAKVLQGVEKSCKITDLSFTAHIDYKNYKG